MTDPGGGNLWLFLEALARRRTFIFVFVLAVTAISVVISLLLPKWYRAEALLLPPKDLSVEVPGVGQFSEVTSLTKGLDLPMMVTSSDVYARILESRTVAERIIGQFDLQSYYGKSNFKRTYKALMGHAEFKVTEEGLLTVSVEDRAPDMAARLTNAFVDELDRVNRDIASERVRQNREFIEGRLRQARKELDSARADFEQFQLEHKAVDFDEQSRLAIEQAIKLKVKLAELDIEMKMYEKNLTESNTELAELKRRRRIISDQLRQLETSNPDTSFFSLPISAIPSLRGQYEELYSRVRVGESLYRILLEQREQVKIQENEQTPTLTVLDRATPPELKSRPKRLLIVLGTFVLSLFIAVFMAAFLDYLNRLQTHSPEVYARIRLFGRAFFGWLPGIRRTTQS
ncbi:MAG: Wzz/FepE/Etk N-terminal domain-containing protein [Candidatus Zixiibacteriota bacterium]